MSSTDNDAACRERKPQIDSLNGLRFVAAMAVVVYHYFSMGESQAGGQSAVPLNGPIGEFLSSWLPMLRDGHLSVDFFAIMSGFVLSYVYCQDIAERQFHYGEFMKRRFARIYPLHLAMLLFCIAMSQVANVFHIPLQHPAGFAASAILPNLLLIQSFDVTNSLTFNGPSWFISAEWFMYILFPLCILVLWKSRLASGTKLVLAIALFLAVYHWQPGGELLTHRTFDFGVLRVGLEFLIGLTLYFVYADYKAAGRTAISAIHVVVIGASILIATQLQAEESLTVVLFPFFIFACVAAETTSGLRWMSHRWLLYGGEISFAIYMIHVPFVSVVRKVVRLIGISSPATLSADLVTVACLIVVVPLAWGVYRYFERPAYRWVLKSFNRSHLPSPPST